MRNSWQLSTALRYLRASPAGRQVPDLSSWPLSRSGTPAWWAGPPPVCRLAPPPGGRTPTRSAPARGCPVWPGGRAQCSGDARSSGTRTDSWDSNHVCTCSRAATFKTFFRVQPCLTFLCKKLATSWQNHKYRWSSFRMDCERVLHCVTFLCQPADIWCSVAQNISNQREAPGSWNVFISQWSFWSQAGELQSCCWWRWCLHYLTKLSWTSVMSDLITEGHLIYLILISDWTVKCSVHSVS